ncbi:MAG TPA: putative inorganic carbon transporter subunit DabA, partial [Polyangiaceae bacterium]|nr:putative inorganic carbon transporter subunit DabA [Polyangiaceae bacterium]
LEERVDLAAGILRGMSLAKPLARLVLLVGHGSSTRNNPHRAGLDCGACSGNTGEVSARAAAALLNDASIREALSPRGLPMPPETRFVPALHDTTTDEVTLFDLDELPETHAADLAELRRWLTAAGAKARAERAPKLGVAAGSAERVLAAVRRRSRDWAEVRPEWGLTGNAGMIVAPRERTRHMDLGGRVFLHEYRQESDAEFTTLELIMTAPMVVAHWINFQYYASTVDNEKFGSGNKVLHNVVGGRIGVFEGNGGDLRIGLPLQSLHDGSRWIHEPLRLSVFIEAPRAAIDGVLRKHAPVRNLVENGWVHLFQIEAADGSVHHRQDGVWSPMAEEIAP